MLTGGPQTMVPLPPGKMSLVITG